jgi:hypothetical protein
MNLLQHRTATSMTISARCAVLGLLLILPLVGCRGGRHTHNSRLREIDEMLDTRLPEGSTKSRVVIYLSSQGFPLQPSKDPRELVALVHHVDTETLKPVTALVTFHFDAADKLKSYNLVEAPDSIPPP